MPTSPLQSVLAWIDNKKRVVGRNARDLINNPSDFGRMLAARTDTDTKEQMADPTAALDFVTGPAGGLAGMIRKGGRPDINMVHNLTGRLDDVIDLINTRGSLSSPSVAIAKDNVFPFQTSPTLVFNPRSPLFDPAQHKGNQLFNRDAYTFRERTPVTIPRSLRDFTAGPETRLNKEMTQERLMMDDMRFTEGALPDTLAQRMATNASPRFKSFADYEKNRAGARNLAEVTEMDREYGDMLYNDASKLFQEVGLYHIHPHSPQAIHTLRQMAKNGNETAVFLLEGLRRMPSDYAELKVLGEVPLTPRNVSALIVPSYWDEPGRDIVQELAGRTGIRTGRPAELVPPDLKDAYSRLSGGLQQYMTNAVQRAEGPLEYDLMPPTVKKYMRPFDVKRLQQNPGHTEEIVPFAIQHSQGLASDVASILTARDAGK